MAVFNFANCNSHYQRHHYNISFFRRQKSLRSLSGQAWVAILLVTTAGEIIFKGVLAPTMPTLCYHVGSPRGSWKWRGGTVHVTKNLWGVVHVHCLYCFADLKANILGVELHDESSGAFRHHWETWVFDRKIRGGMVSLVHGKKYQISPVMPLWCLGILGIV